MRDAPSPKRKQLMHSLGRQGTRVNPAIVIAITAKARHSRYTTSRVGVRTVLHARAPLWRMEMKK